ncbi:MAG: CSLREA domain-containing protein, partial [Pseudomonadota bacterium]
MADFLVTTLADEDNGATNGMSLREAIQLANSNGNAGIEDVITFASDLAGQTITLTEGPLVITDDLRIDGDALGDTTGKETGRADDITITTAIIENFASQVAVTPAGYTSPGTVTLEEAIGTFGDFRIFEVRQDGTDAAFNALTLTGAGVYTGGNPFPGYGQMGAAIYQADFEAGTTGTLPDDSAFSFTWDEEAGDLDLAVKTTVAVTHSTISDNYGTAIVAGHRFTMEDSVLSGNHGGFAAGIFIAALEGEATLRDVHVKDHDLISARATLGTGAPGGDFIVENSEITNNRMVDTDVGGVLLNTGAGVFFSGSPGGGISITDSVVKDNQGILAGAIATGSPDQDITVKNSVFENNIARGDWLASFGGGAIAVAAVGADVYVEGSSFVDNKNVANGGGAFAIGGTSNIFEIVNSTLTGNVSGKSGGAIGFQGTSNKIALVNSTVVDNHIVENPITDLNGLTPASPDAIATAIGLFPEFGSTGGLFNFLSYERFASNGGDNQTGIENSIIAGNTNLGVASDVHFELGWGDAIDFLTEIGVRFDPNTGRSFVDTSLIFIETL